MKQPSLALVGAALWVALAASSAQAATVDLGQTGLGPCGGSGYSDVQTATAGPPVYAAPSDGLITSWSAMGNGDTSAMVKLRIFRRTSTADTFLVVADGTPQLLTANVLNGPFPVSIPVKQGDLLGLNIVAGSSPPCTFGTPSVGDAITEFNPDTAAVGDTETATTLDIPFVRVNVSATFVPRPEISSLSPSSGPRTGGTAVTISGHDFGGATAVSFGGVPAASYTVDSDTRITATTPAEPAGTVEVGVRTPAGTTAATAADRFTFSEVCIVPKLKGKKLKRAKRKLRSADCRVGKRKGPKDGKVKKQSPPPGTVLPAGGSVNVKLR